MKTLDHAAADPLLTHGGTAGTETSNEAPRLALRAALLLALVAPSLNMTLLPPALPMIAAYLGGGVQGEIVAQQAQALPFLGLAAGGLLAGTVIARLGLKRSIAAGALLYALGGVVGGAAIGSPMLLLGCLAIGLAASLLTSALTAASGSIYHGDGRTRILGFQTAASDFGAISAGVLGALLAQGVGWRGPFAVYIGFGAMVLALIARAELPSIAPPSDSRSGLRAVATSAGTTYLAGFGIFLMLGTIPTLLPFHLAASGLALPSERAIVLTMPPLAAMIAALAALTASRIAERWVILLATGFSAAGFAGLAFWSGGLLPATVATAGIGIGVGLAMPLVFRAAFRRTDKSLHGYSIGLLNFANFGAAFLSPVLLGPVMRQVGAEPLFFICTAAWALAGGLVFLNTRRRVASTAGKNVKTF